MPASYARGRDADVDGARREATAVDLVRAARGDPSRVALEGVHALKHAVRFGADVELVVTPDPGELSRLLEQLAPDVALPVPPTEVTASAWRACAVRALPSPVLAVARRPVGPGAAVTGAAPPALPDGPGRVVVLEQPRHLGNLGAAIRVAAAADASGVVVVGEADPWHPTAVRAAAGLQFALPVSRLSALPPTDRPVVAVAPDPGGAGLTPHEVPSDAALLFGTERAGLSSDLRARAESTVAVPMRAGVSSLNLATAVAVLLYAG